MGQHWQLMGKSDKPKKFNAHYRDSINAVYLKYHVFYCIKQYKCKTKTLENLWWLYQYSCKYITSWGNQVASDTV